MSNQSQFKVESFASAFKLKTLGLKFLTRHTDTLLGFSAIKKYSPTELRKLKISPGAEFASLVRVHISNKDLEDPNLNLKPLRIQVSFCLVRGGVENQGAEYFSYSPEKDAHIKDKAREPIESHISGAFYDPRTNHFFEDGRRTSAAALLKKVWDVHMSPSKSLLRRILRRIQNIRFSLSEGTVDFLEKVLLTIWEEDYSYIERLKLETRRSDSRTFLDESRVPNKDLPIDIFGYRASPRVIGTYCVLHLFVFAIFFLSNFFPQFLKLIVNNNFLTILYVAPSLYLFDKKLPILIKRLIRSLSRL